MSCYTNTLTKFTSKLLFKFCIKVSSSLNYSNLDITLI